VKEVVASIKKGRSFVSSGPLVEFELTDSGRSAKPGDEIAHARRIEGHVKVRAAPWVDVTSLEILAGVPAPPPAHGGAPPAGPTVSLLKVTIAPRPTQVGKEEGKLDELQARTIRYEGDVTLKPPDGARWIVAVVRGDRAMDDVLPFMPIQPLAFTNPIWLAK
jgi:hypothetical protein